MIVLDLGCRGDQAKISGLITSLILVVGTASRSQVMSDCRSTICRAARDVQTEMQNGALSELAFATQLSVKHPSCFVLLDGPEVAECVFC